MKEDKKLRKEMKREYLEKNKVVVKAETQDHNEWDSILNQYQ